jgi:radical SAM protein with 4Fe4S-binding SPASM domain
MGRGRILYINIWNACNLSCCHCFNHEGKTAGTLLDKEAVISITARARSFFGMETVQLSGGEPVQRHDFFEIADLLLEHGFRVLLQTNGILSEGHMKKLLRYSGRNIELIVSLDGLGTHDLLRGEGNAEKVIANLEILSRYFIIRVNTMLTSKIEWAEIESVALLAQQFNLSLAFNPVCPCGRAGRNLLMPVRQYFDWMYRLETLRESGITIRKGFDLLNNRLVETENCPVRKGAAIHIAADGSVYPCGFLSGIVSCRTGSADNTEFETLENALRQLSSTKLPDFCSECGYYLNSRCHGGCPARIYALNGTWNMPDFYCLADYEKQLKQS